MLFLERINAVEADPDRIREWASRSPVDNLLDSIQANLQNVLSSRRGMCATRPQDYGLPDVENMLVGDKTALQELRGAIQRCVEQFEPRLSAPRIELRPILDEEGRTRSVTAHIEGIIRVNGREHMVGYEAVRNAKGHFEVRG